jgi:hypothetical protein
VNAYGSGAYFPQTSWPAEVPASHKYDHRRWDA